MNKILTYKQQKVLGAIRDYVERQGESPTLADLRARLGFSSSRTVTQYLDILEEKGYLVRRHGFKRNIELLNADGAWGSTISVPIIASVGCDDLSVFAAEERTEFLEVDKKIVEEDSGGIVAVRSVGDSMTDAGINPGDYVLIRFTDHAENGDRVAAIVGDMVTVKRFERVPGGNGQPGMVVLWPESKNPKYKPIVLREDFKIAGKVLCVIPAMHSDISEIVPLERW